MKQVDGAPLPGDKIEDWMVFGDAQTARLDMANDRITNGYATIKRCEQRDEAARIRATKHGLFG